VTIDSRGRKANLVVGNGALSAVPRSDKETKGLGSGSKEHPQVPEAALLSGGQDAVGAEFFNGGRIVSLQVAADGCSFGDFHGSARAAQIAVEDMLGGGKEIAARSDLSRQEIVQWMEATVRVANKRIQKEAPGGATALSAVALSSERVSGRENIYAHIVGIGDAQVIIVGIKPTGEVKFSKVITPADQLTRIVRAKVANFYELNIVERVAAREKAIEDVMQAGNMDRARVEDLLGLGSAITSYMGSGERGGADITGKVNSDRINLTEDMFDRGYTQVKVIACSDNLGEKVEESDIIAAVTGTKGNRALTERITALMGQQDADDGCMSVISVVQPQSPS
jgi:serine/threonine protein phosphatase PrpC